MERIYKTTLDGYEGVKAGDLFGAFHADSNAQHVVIWTPNGGDENRLDVVEIHRTGNTSPSRWTWLANTTDMDRRRKNGLVHLGVYQSMNPDAPLIHQHPTMQIDNILELLRQKQLALRDAGHGVDQRRHDVLAWAHAPTNLLYVIDDHAVKPMVLATEDGRTWMPQKGFNVPSLLRQRKLVILGTFPEDHRSTETHKPPLIPDDRQLAMLALETRRRVVGDTPLPVPFEFQPASAGLTVVRRKKRPPIPTATTTSPTTSPTPSAPTPPAAGPIQMLRIPNELGEYRKRLVVIAPSGDAEPRMFIPVGGVPNSPHLYIREVTQQNGAPNVDWDATPARLSIAQLDEYRKAGRVGIVRTDITHNPGDPALPPGVLDAAFRLLGRLQDRMKGFMRSDPPLMTEDVVTRSNGLTG